MSKTGMAGYIASFPIPEVVMGINAFTLAARKVNPDFKTNVVWVSTWYDPAKEADAAKALFDQGADIIAQHTDSPAALQAAEQRGLYAPSARPGTCRPSRRTRSSPRSRTTGASTTSTASEGDGRQLGPGTPGGASRRASSR